MDNIDELCNPFDEEMRQVEQMQTLFDKCVAVRFDTLRQLVDEQLARGQRAEQLLQGFNTLMITILTDNFLLYELAQYAIQGETEYYFLSDFLDSLSRDDKKRYSFFDVENGSTADLPYFQEIVELVSTIQIINRLQPKEDRAIEIAATEKEQTQTFGAKISGKQFTILAQAINEAGLFTVPITVGRIENLLDCKIAEPLQVSNLKLLVYLFEELSDHKLIANQWQKVVVANKLFLSKHGKESNDHDLRGAKRKIYDRYEGTKPKNHKIIDDCIEDITTIN